MTGYHRRADAAVIARDGLVIRDLTGADAAGATLVDVDVAAGAIHPPTRSTRSASLYYCVQGELEFEVGANRHRVEAGDLIQVAANEWFAYRNLTDTTARLVSVNVPPFDAATFEQRA